MRITSTTPPLVTPPLPSTPLPSPPQHTLATASTDRDAIPTLEEPLTDDGVVDLGLEHVEEALPADLLAGLGALHRRLRHQADLARFLH